MTDLRRAIQTSISIGAPWVSVAEVAAIAGCDPGTALRELRRQVHLGHLAEPEPQRFRPGPRWKEYRSSPCTTRAGGNTKAYRMAKAARDEIRRRAWEVARKAGKGEGLTCGPSATLRHSTAGDDNMPSPRSVTVCTMADAADQLGISKRTLERWIADNRIVPIRYSPRLVRIRVEDVVRLASGIAHAQG